VIRAVGLKNALFWAIVVVLILLALWFVPKWQVGTLNPEKTSPAEISTLENENRRTLAQIVGGLALVGTLYFTWRRVTATERTVEISQESYITERFTQAIAQLGDDKLEVRLGAIYALERIAKDSEKDYWPIMEVLTAYLRKNAHWPRGHSGTIRLDRDVPSDTQAVMTVLNRRARHYGNGEEFRLDLRNTDLRGIDFADIHLEGARLEGSRLDSAMLHGAHFEQAWLVDAHFEGTGLIGEHLPDKGWAKRGRF
jgi:hypothetical protein